MATTEVSQLKVVLRDELAKRHAADRRAAESTTELAAARQAQHEAEAMVQAASGRAARLRQSSEQQAHMLRRAREVASAERRREPSDRTEGSRAGTPGSRSEALLSPAQRREGGRLSASRSAPPTPEPTRDLAPELTPELAALRGGEGELQQLRDMVKELERYIAELEGALAEAARERGEATLQRDEARQQLKAERAARTTNAERAERARGGAATAGVAAAAGGAGGAEARPEATASQLAAPKAATGGALQRALEEKRGLQAALEAARQQLLEANARGGKGGGGGSSGYGGGGPARSKRLLPPQGRTPLQICSSNPPPVWRPWSKAGSPAPSPPRPATSTPSKSDLLTEASVEDVRALLVEARAALGL